MDTGMGRGRFIKEIRDLERFHQNMARIPSIIAATQDTSHRQNYAYKFSTSSSKTSQSSQILDDQLDFEEELKEKTVGQLCRKIHSKNCQLKEQEQAFNFFKEKKAREKNYIQDKTSVDRPLSQVSQDFKDGRAIEERRHEWSSARNPACRISGTTHTIGTIKYLYM